MKNNRYYIYSGLILIIALLLTIIFFLVDIGTSVNSIIPHFSKIDQPSTKSNNRNNLFHSKAESFIHLEIQTDDTISLDLMAYSKFPLALNNNFFSISHDTIFTISVTNNNPNLAVISLENQSFRIFIYPNDTSFINLSKKGRIISCNHHHNSKNNLIINYYLNKDKVLGYNDRWQVLPSIIGTKLSIENFCTKADVIYRSELMYFDSCNLRTQFPDWFVEYERNEILYFNASTKLGGIYYHNKQLNDSLNYEDYNLTFLDTIIINNESAYLSSIYYEFLNNYNIHIGYNNLIKLDGIDHPFKIVDIYEDSLSKLLSDEISNKYFIQLSSQVIVTLPNSYVRYGLDTNKIYPFMDSILLSVHKRRINKGYKNYVDNWYDKLKEKARNVKILKDGDKAPRFYLSDEKETYHDLKNYKGKIVMLNFWVEFCKPCLNTVTEKNNIVNRYSDDNFELINIFLSKNKERWKRLIKDKNILGVNLIPKGNWLNNLKLMYNVTEFPTYVLIDENGMIIQNKIGGLEEVERIIENKLEHL